MPPRHGYKVRPDDQRPLACQMCGDLTRRALVPKTSTVTRPQLIICGRCLADCDGERVYMDADGAPA